MVGDCRIVIRRPAVNRPQHSIRKKPAAPKIANSPALTTEATTVAARKVTSNMPHRRANADQRQRAARRRGY